MNDHAVSQTDCVIIHLIKVELLSVSFCWRQVTCPRICQVPIRNTNFCS